MFRGLVLSVLGVDPGKHTGLALVELYHGAQKKPEPTGLVPNHSLRFRFGATVEEQDRATTIREFVVKGSDPGGQPLLVAAEKFTATRRTLQTQDTQALEAIGALKAVMELLGAPQEALELQLPSAAKTVVTDEKLRQMGLLDKTSKLDVHGRDALRHAVFRCVTYVRTP